MLLTITLQWASIFRFYSNSAFYTISSFAGYGCHILLQQLSKFDYTYLCFYYRQEINISWSGLTTIVSTICSIWCTTFNISNKTRIICSWSIISTTTPVSISTSMNWYVMSMSLELMSLSCRKSSTTVYTSSIIISSNKFSTKIRNVKVLSRSSY